MATERRLPAREAQPPVSRPHRRKDRRKRKRHGQRLQPLPAAPAPSLLGRSAATAADGPPRRHHRLAPAGRAASGRRLAGLHLTGQLGRLLRALPAGASAARRQRRRHRFTSGSAPAPSPPSREEGGSGGESDAAADRPTRRAAEKKQVASAAERGRGLPAGAIAAAHSSPPPGRGAGLACSLPPAA